MFGWLQDRDNYDSRKVARTLVDGLIVSTAYTSDEGYETAIIDMGDPDVHPVERYDSREEAEAGHQKWCDKAKVLTCVNRLGGWGVVPDEITELVRMSKEYLEDTFPKDAYGG